ncbi:MAG: type II toxin-antitoxin system RelE/ParE family toxin [Rhodocyclaceae bacterium]|jgi:plasmid stabilization system protein ParE|nr:type II toxin-antitoxin system RelE/ParE family toxin [Rhodocyclaceae bacterium]
MAGRPLEWSRLAERDYLSALAYLAEVAGEAIALRVLERTEKALRLISRQPDIGTPGRSAGTREYAVAHTGHTIIYRVAARRIVILRYWHQRRDI